MSLLLTVTKPVERVARQVGPRTCGLNHCENCQVAFLRVLFLKLNMEHFFLNIPYPMRTPRDTGVTQCEFAVIT